MGTNAYTDVHHTAYTLTTAGSWRRRPGTRMGFRILLLHVLSSGRTPLTIPQRARERGGCRLSRGGAALFHAAWAAWPFSLAADNPGSGPLLGSQPFSSHGTVALLPLLDHVLYPTITDAGFVTEVYHVDGEGAEASGTRRGLYAD